MRADIRNTLLDKKVVLEYAQQLHYFHDNTSEKTKLEVQGLGI
jgi:hypothetical protein